MRTLIEQVDRSLQAGLYYLSLFGALAIPDIAGALNSADGQASGKRYKAWYEEWVRPRFKENCEKALEKLLPPWVRQYTQDVQEVRKSENPLTGNDCYLFRCSLLHQGSSQHPKKTTFSRIIFIESRAVPNSFVHYNVRIDTLGKTLLVDLNSFCIEVSSGARMWLDKVENTDRYKSNYYKFARRHPEGLKPYIVGIPVIG